MSETLQVTKPTNDKKIEATISAVSLETHLIREFEGNPTNMAKHFGTTGQQIKRWLAVDAVVINDCIYLRKSSFPETAKEKYRREEALFSDVDNPSKDPKCTTLVEHIQAEYEGNQTAFAQANKSRQQQVFRWVNHASCVYLCGQVYRYQCDLNNLDE